MPLDMEAFLVHRLAALYRELEEAQADEWTGRTVQVERAIKDVRRRIAIIEAEGGLSRPPAVHQDGAPTSRGSREPGQGSGRQSQ